MKKIFIGILIGILTSSVTVYAFTSSSISYSTLKNSSVKTVEDALNDLYKKQNDDVLLVNPWNFGYTGKPVTFTIPTDGIYKLEVWGAQGGSNTYASAPGGKGGYSIGYYTAKKGDKLYIYVGGEGLSLNGKTSEYGGWNGGGGLSSSSFESTYDKYNGTGGGSTDISLVYSEMTKNSQTLRYERTLASYNGRIIVAGAGGGGGDLYHVRSISGGAGGGLQGESFGGTQDGITEPNQTNGLLATASLGLGGSANSKKTWACVVGGGAGYYGGSHSQANLNATNTKSSGGGSGYIGGVSDYNNEKAKTISGTEKMPTYDGSDEMTGNSGNGFAKITFVASS